MSLAGLVDELGVLEAELKPFRSKIARAEALRAAIRSEFRDAAPASEHTIAGEQYAVLVGACGNVSVVDTPALIERVGMAEYTRIATVTLKALQTHFGPGIIASVVSTVQSGPRALTVSAIAQPEAAKESTKKAARKRAAKR
ncbi:MAG: hypothetical protein JO061_03640 [Acidobacteriaceae bacterium]|nr:hypothetical protein [Acidobacteriaceae bacterium]